MSKQRVAVTVKQIEATAQGKFHYEHLSDGTVMIGIKVDACYVMNNGSNERLKECIGGEVTAKLVISTTGEKL